MSSVVIADPLFPSNDRQVGVNTVKSDGRQAARHDASLHTVEGEPDAVSRVVNFSVNATAALDIVTIGPSIVANKVLRLRRIVLVNPGSATAAIVVDLQLGTASSVGSGGSAVSAQPLDQGNRALGVTGGPDGTALECRIGDTTQATGFVAVYSPLVSVSVPAAAGGFTPQVIYDARDPRCKPLTVASGQVAVVLRTPAIGAGATALRGYAEYTVDDA